MIIPHGAGNITNQVARVLLKTLGQRPDSRATADNLPGAGDMR